MCIRDSCIPTTEGHVCSHQAHLTNVVAIRPLVRESAGTYVSQTINHWGVLKSEAKTVNGETVQLSLTAGTGQLTGDSTSYYSDNSLSLTIKDNWVFNHASATGGSATTPSSSHSSESSVPHTFPCFCLYSHPIIFSGAGHPWCVYEVAKCMNVTTLCF